MAEGLTKEAIDQICDLMELHRWIDAIKALRTAWPFGLKEARGFLDQYRSDITALRNRLFQMANIVEGVTFENGDLLIEVKRTGVNFMSAHEFLIEALLRICPNADITEKKAAFLHAAEQLLAEASWKELDFLYGQLMDQAVKSELTVGIVKV